MSVALLLLANKKTLISLKQNFLLVPAEARFEPSTLGSIADCYAS
jgi:hypothetical protein